MLIENRQDWVVEEAQAMCDKLGYPLPLVSFIEEKLFGIPMRIRVVRDIHGQRLFARSIDPGELRISPTFLAESDDGKIRHTLAFALAFADPKAMKRMSNLGMFYMGLAMLPAVLASGAVWLLTDSKLWTGCLVAILFVPSILLAMKLQLPIMSESWVRAIELSGETEAAFAMLRVEPKPDPKWVPAFFSRWARRYVDERRSYIEKEATRRGLLMSREDS